MVDIVQFPEERIQLMLEVREHPQLMELLQELHVPYEDFGSRIACVAAYCNVMMDGAYTEQDLNKLCDILILKLKDKRKAIITL